VLSIGDTNAGEIKGEEEKGAVNSECKFVGYKRNPKRLRHKDRRRIGIEI